MTSEIQQICNIYCWGFILWVKCDFRSANGDEIEIFLFFTFLTCYIFLKIEMIKLRTCKYSFTICLVVILLRLYSLATTIIVLETEMWQKWQFSSIFSVFGFLSKFHDIHCQNEIGYLKVYNLGMSLQNFIGLAPKLTECRCFGNKWIFHIFVKFTL